MLTPLAALAHFIPLTAFMSEQPLAFALPGFCLAVGALVERLAAPGLLLPPVKLRDRAVLGLLCLAWLAMAGQTFARVRQWASPEALWAAEAALHPASAQPLIEQLDACVHQSNADAARRLAREARRKGSPAELDRVRELEALLAANIKDDDRLKELIDEALDAKRKPGRDHLSRMAVYARDRDFRAESTDLWRRELQLYPTSFDALYELAQTALDDKNLKDAIRFSADAVRFAPNRRMWARAQERYGVILAESGQVKVAAMTLQQALAVEPTLYRAYIYLARIFWGAKEYQRALDVLNACFQNVSHSLTSYVDLAQMYTGILEDLNQTRLALDWIQGQMASFPSDIPLQIWGARYLIEFGFYDRAYQTYQMVMASPVANDAKSKVAVGLGLLELRVNKHPKEAARYWRSALQLDPTNDDAKRQLDALDQAVASAKDQNSAAPAATAAQTSASAAVLPAAPAPAVAPAPALPSGSGLSLGAPLSGLSVSRPDLATTASKPQAAPKPAAPAATPAATPRPTASPTPAAPTVTPAAPKPAAPAVTPAATPRPTASPAPAAHVAKPAATPAATPVRTPAVTPVATPAATPAPKAK
jgi:tetratricopeptide (TPR) repeat protein